MTHKSEIQKELFRKTIHLCAAFVPIFASYCYYSTLIALSIVLILYCIFEKLRISGTNIPLVSAITDFAARNRDGKHFVFGPVTLALGVMFSLILFSAHNAQIGIWAVAFGDGLASLVGKLLGKKRLKLVPDKSLAGSIACFFAVFSAGLFANVLVTPSLIIATIATLLEALPLKDFDNIVIPLGSAAVASLIL